MTTQTTRRSLASAAIKGESTASPSRSSQARSGKNTAVERNNSEDANGTKQVGKSKGRSSPNTSRKRRHDRIEPSVKEEEKDEVQDGHDHRPSKRGRANAQPSKASMEAGVKMAESFAAARDEQREEPGSAKEALTKNNPYGLSPGESPFPAYIHPTSEECHEVRRILAKAHGNVEAPTAIPTPSLNSSGCGEVPSILDALVRTRLSAATNNANSSRAFKGLVETFGIIEEGVGKGSVDWNKVRQAPIKQVFEAIKSGGLADVKSRDIQKILNMVHEENQQRKDELHNKSKAGEDGIEESMEARQKEIAKASHDVLSLDHLHLLDNDTAFNKLLEYPGVGPKTASCVLLFCMQRPSFAVDTHVFRLTRWLGWMPTDAQAKTMMKKGEAKSAQVTRNSTHAHLDVKIPDELKYPLHYLLIKHGKNCGWCSAKAGKDRKTGSCPLAALMKGKGRNKGSAKKDEVYEDERFGAESAEERSEDEASDVKKEE